MGLRFNQAARRSVDERKAERPPDPARGSQPRLGAAVCGDPRPSVLLRGDPSAHRRRRALDPRLDHQLGGAGERPLDRRGLRAAGALPRDPRPALGRLVVSAAIGRAAPIGARASGLRGGIRAAAGRRPAAAPAAPLVRRRGPTAQRLRLRRHPDASPAPCWRAPPSRRSSPTSSGT